MEEEIQEIIQDLDQEDQIQEDQVQEDLTQEDQDQEIILKLLNKEEHKLMSIIAWKDMKEKLIDL